MAISTYAELKAAVSDWMDRSDITGTAADLITLAEARLNRLLDVVETDATLTGATGSGVIDISALNIIEPISLFGSASSDQDEFEVMAKSAGSFPYDDTAGAPGYYAVNGTNIRFDRPLNADYSFRFRYRGRFALSDQATTNDLLTNHPDVYLAASIMWGGVYISDAGKVQGYKMLLDEFISETKSHLAQKKRSTLTPDRALWSKVGSRRGTYVQ
jgi:hypothetical protein